MLDLLAGCEIARTPTVIFTQKALPEVQKLADRVILMPAVEEECLTPFLYVFPLWFLGYHFRSRQGKLVGERRFRLEGHRYQLSGLSEPPSKLRTGGRNKKGHFAAEAKESFVWHAAFSKYSYDIVMERERKMKRKSLLVKVLSVSLACLMAAGSLAGCNSGGGGEASGSQTATDGKYDLTFWTYSDMVLNDQGKLLDGWVEDFVAENDDVNSISVVAKDDADLLTSLMAGVGCRICFALRAGIR